MVPSLRAPVERAPLPTWAPPAVSSARWPSMPEPPAIQRKRQAAVSVQLTVSVRLIGKSLTRSQVLRGICALALP